MREGILISNKYQENLTFAIINAPVAEIIHGEIHKSVQQKRLEI